MKMTESQYLAARRTYGFIHNIWMNGVDWTKKRAPREFPVYEGEVNNLTLEYINSFVWSLCSFADDWCKGRRHVGKRGCVETCVGVLRALEPKSYRLEDVQKYIQDIHTWSTTLACDLELN